MTISAPRRARTSTGRICEHLSVGEACVGQIVEVSGTVRCVTLHPSEGLARFEAEIDDGTGRVSLVWLGRRRMNGIEPSCRITARGRVAEHNGGLAIFNPEYEIRLPSQE